MPRPTLDDDDETFLAKLKGAGGHLGNFNLMTRLGWAEDRYWRTHARVINEGFAARGRGQGGSVTFVSDEVEVIGVPAEEAASAESEKVAEIYKREYDLYEPALRAIENGWVRERSYDEVAVELTAQAGRGKTGGIWTRPDVTVLASKSYPYLPGRHFDIVTFEIKSVETVDVRGVFEALSHGQFATLAYAVFHTGGRAFDTFASADRVKDLASRHGVGVIAAGQMDDYQRWDEIVEPRRNIYDPDQANLFIQASISEQNRNKIIKWFK